MTQTAQTAQENPIMAPWFAHLHDALLYQQEADYAGSWEQETNAELERIDGQVPFSVVHDWQANVVCPLVIEAYAKRSINCEPHQALQALHLRALNGETISATEWRPVLELAFAFAQGYSEAHDSANGYDEEFAEALIHATATAHANAFALDKASTYNYAIAYADATAHDWHKLAVGMTECLKRVP